MTDYDPDIVDLTTSYALADHCNIANEVIVIDTDDSFEISNVHTKKTSIVNKERKSTAKKSTRTVKEPSVTKLKRKSNKSGNCPICFEELGKNPLASTKCGHVFCLKCLEQSLKFEKKCPNCRIQLKGATAYHRLYLSL